MAAEPSDLPRPSAPRPKASAGRIAITAAAASALWAPLLPLYLQPDVDSLREIAALSRLGVFWFSTAVMAAVALAAYLLFLVTARALGGPRAKAWPAALAASAGGVCLTAWPPQEAGPDWLTAIQEPLLLLPMLATAGLVALGVFALVKRLTAIASGADAWGFRLLSAPLLLLAACLTRWSVVAWEIDPNALAPLTIAAILAASTLCFRFGPSANGKILTSVYGFTLAAILAGLGWPWLFSPATASRREAPAMDHAAIRKIILITVDTLRRDAVSALGGSTPTPYIDRLAAESVRFTRAVSPAPWTLPAMVSLLTGVSPGVHGASSERDLAPTHPPTLAERLGEVGYLTQSFGFNPFLSPYSGPASGMQRGFPHPLFGPMPQGPEYPVSPLLYQRQARATQYFLSTTDITDSASAWATRHAGESFFLWLHYFDPHMPFNPPGEFLPPPESGVPALRAYGYQDMNWVEKGGPERREAVKRLYSAETRHVDAEIGRLLEQLRRLEIYDDALIVLAADHGEEFWEHGGFEHGHSLYQELLQVPLFFKLPFGREAGERSTRVSTEAVTPTILTLAGVNYNAARLSVASLASRGTPGFVNLPDSPTFASGISEGPPQDAVSFDEWKYIRRESQQGDELYRLDVDPEERHNVALNFPEIAEQGRRLLRRHEAKSKVLRDNWGIDSGRKAVYTASRHRLLRSLGYIR